jgi:hypothetical protein
MWYEAEIYTYVILWRQKNAHKFLELQFNGTQKRKSFIVLVVDTFSNGRAVANDMSVHKKCEFIKYWDSPVYKRTV